MTTVGPDNGIKCTRHVRPEQNSRHPTANDKDDTQNPVYGLDKTSYRFWTPRYL